ncbi:hypothetical protein O7632_31375 [Solwaraspora sp. WMMD406]|uniref:hypothetical protein n=1 Tax=Solwaraspora sp. WMMD406 TaxID=3016095 RepID=UPI00241778CC|nr:hypothetical protein [Solwaraspora sp. WMMD406]MDG4768560.1 hypothetical protein [Solwaraspora sp. WMMD406]
MFALLGVAVALAFAVPAIAAMSSDEPPSEPTPSDTAPAPAPPLASPVPKEDVPGDRLWWKRASDFWHLVLHYDRGDHSCDHLFFSGETFLHWWTANQVQVRDAFAAQP